MNEHHCLLCMGSNTNRFTQLSDARKVLSEAFPDIHFGELMETQAIGSGFHSPFSNQLARFTTTVIRVRPQPVQGTGTTQRTPSRR